MERIRHRNGMRAAATSATSALLLTLAFADVVAAQQTDRDRVERKWAALHASARQQLTAPITRLEVIQSREEATRQHSVGAAADAVDDDSSGAATVRRLAGAIKTSPQGAEAGIVIAPFVLAGSTQLQGFELTFASLKGDFTRAAASYTWDKSRDDVWNEPDMCPVTKAREEALEEPRDFYLNACTQVIAVLPQTLPAASTIGGDDRTTYQARIQQARIACGLTDSAPNGPGVASLPEALALIRRALEITNVVAARSEGDIPAAVRTMALTLRPDAVKFQHWTVPASTSCYNAKAVRAHFQQLYWEKRKRKFALAASWDLFPRKFGFSPDEAPLPQGNVKVAEARADFSTSRAGSEVSGGIGLGRAREEFSGDFQGYVAASLSMARAVSLLPNRMLLTTAGELNIVDGELPPRLVFGIILKTEIALDKPASQVTRFKSVKVQPHLDFVINDALSFRLGIPVQGEIAIRKAKAEQAATPTTVAVPAVPERRALQWTVPVAIVAVIKM